MAVGSDCAEPLTSCASSSRSWGSATCCPTDAAHGRDLHRRSGAGCRSRVAILEYVVTVPQVVGLHPRAALDALVSAGLEPMIVELPALRSDGSFGYAVADQHPRAAADVAFGA